MKDCIKFGIFFLFIILLGIVVSDEEYNPSNTIVTPVQTSYLTISMPADRAVDSRKVHTDNWHAPFDKIDHTFSQTPELKYLFPVTLKYPLYRPEIKTTKPTSPDITAVFSCPVTHYVYGLRKILI